MKNIIPINSKKDIPENYKKTPISDLLEYHNLDKPHKKYTSAQMLIGMCIDNRKKLNIPENFAFIIRAGGANLRFSEFKVSYSIGVGGVGTIALIGHTNCGMVKIADRKEIFIKGLIDRAGWTREKAEKHFDKYEPKFEIYNEIEFVLSEVKRLRKVYPSVLIAPMLYKVEDNKLYLLDEK